MERAEIIACRREFVIPGYKRKYKMLADVGFDGEQVTGRDRGGTTYEDYHQPQGIRF